LTTGFLTAIVTALALLNLWMFFQMPSMIFFPVRTLDATPDTWGLAYEDAWFTAADGNRLHGWYIPNENARLTMLFMHGNAGNISHRSDSIRIFHDAGMHVFIFDYRGYGNSEGAVSEDGIYADARAAWSYLLKTRGARPEDIIIFGRSLGATAAARLASEVRPAGVILESTFSSARAMADRVLPGLSRLIYLRYRLDTIGNVKNISAPLLVMHSPDDEIIPYSLGRSVFEAARPPKEFYDLRGDHNGGFLASQPGYGRRIAEFIGRPAAKSKPGN